MNIYPGGDGNRRRQAIRALVNEGGVRSQEDLQRRLKRRGIEVAQPTLSRDLKALGLAKTPSRYGSANAGALRSAQGPGSAQAPVRLREPQRRRLRLRRGPRGRARPRGR